MKLSSSSKGYFLVAFSGIFYGISGLFVKSLATYGVPTYLLGFFRPLIAFVIFFIYLFFRKRQLLKVDRKGLCSIALLGLLSQTLFNRLYFSTISQTTIATAVVLLYTAPIFVVFLAYFIYREPLSLSKIMALIVSIIGCFFATTGGSFEVLKLNGMGLLLGLGTGFTFSLLPILSKDLVTKYHHLTIACYSMGFGALFSLFFFHPRELLLIDYNMHVLFQLLALGFLCTTVAFGVYTTGMSYGIQSSKASIINAVEVPVAVFTSFIFFQEHIFGVKLLGVALVLLSVVLVEYGDAIFVGLGLKKEKREKLPLNTP